MIVLFIKLYYIDKLLFLSNFYFVTILFDIIELRIIYIFNN